MVSHEQLILLIREYVSDNTLPDYTFFSAKNGYFQEQSYLLWAAEELIAYISERKTASAIQTLNDFAEQMKEFAKLKPNYVFESAYQLATDVIDVCNNAGWTNQTYI